MIRRRPRQGLRVGRLKPAAIAAALLWVAMAWPASAAEDRSPYCVFTEPDTPRIEEVETAFLHYARDEFCRSLGDGWREEHSNSLVIHSNCLWACSVVSSLSVTVLRPRPLVLALVMRPHFIDKAHPQELGILWNGTPIGTCRFEPDNGWDFRSFSLEVPAAAQRVGRNTVTFASRYALSAKDVGRGGEDADARRIAFGLVSLELCEPGQTPVDTLKAETLPAPKLTAADFREGNLVQAPGSRLRFPVAAPEGARSVFRADAPADRADVWLRWDDADGVREMKLGAAAHEQGVRYEADLTPLAGRPVEAVFDASRADAESAVTWFQPGVWVSGPPPAAPAPSAPPAARPAVTRVVVICLDALRADALGATGALRPVSPFLDSMVNTGIRYERMYATASWTFPSVLSLFTGQYPLAHGVHAVEEVVNPAVPLLAERLKEAGIVTGCIAENNLFDGRYQLNRGFDAYHFIYPAQIAGKPKGSPEVTRLALEFLKTHTDDRFLLYLHYLAPHGPYSIENPYKQTLTYDPIETIKPLDDYIYWAELGRVAKTAEGVKHLRARYDENTLYVDGQVREVVTAMQELGYGPETAIVVFSDHGEAFEHGHLGHSDTPYETLIRSLFLVRFGPAGQPEPERRAELVRMVDVFPTICGWLGVSVPDGLPGRRLGDPPPGPSPMPMAYAESQDRPALEAYVWDRYKLIRDAGGTRLEVYDLAEDPDETCDLAARRPVLADYLLAHALAWRQSAVNRRIAPPSKTELDKETNKQLRALGYL